MYFCFILFDPVKGLVHSACFIRKTSSAYQSFIAQNILNTVD